MFTIAGDDRTGDNNPNDFNECVSQEQLQAAVENAQKRMNEAIRKAVTDALIELNIGNNMEIGQTNFHTNRQGYWVRNLGGGQR